MKRFLHSVALFLELNNNHHLKTFLYSRLLCHSSSYHKQMCGLCGNYDGSPDNDFTKPDGTLVGNANDFSNSWQTEEDEDDV